MLLSNQILRKIGLPVALGLLGGTLGCTSLLKPPVYAPEKKERFGTPEVTIRAPSNAALFTLLVRRVNVSRSNSLAWISRRSVQDYRAYEPRIRGLIEKRWKLRLVENEDILDSDAYLAGRFPVREKFFLNPGLMPIIRGESDKDLMLRLGRALDTDYFITVFVDHRILKFVFLAPRLEARIVMQLYSYQSGHIASYEVSNTVPAKCPDGPSNGRPDLLCEEAINTALNEAMEKTFAEIDEVMQEVRIQAPRERRRSRRPRPAPPVEPEPGEERTEPAKTSGGTGEAPANTAPAAKAPAQEQPAPAAP